MIHIDKQHCFQELVYMRAVQRCCSQEMLVLANDHPQRTASSAVVDSQAVVLLNGWSLVCACLKLDIYLRV